MTDSTSPVASRLGYLALVPFLAGAALVFLSGANSRAFVAAALNAYAAVVVSFLGGIHWGFGFRAARPSPGVFFWGVTPSLVACAALLLASPVALLLHAVMLSVCYAVDRRLYPQHGSGHWLPLRLHLTLVAVASCLAGAYGAWRLA